MNWILRGCRSCGGDLLRDEEDQGWATCLLCGREVELPKPLTPRYALKPWSTAPEEEKSA